MHNSRKAPATIMSTSTVSSPRSCKRNLLLAVVTTIITALLLGFAGTVILAGLANGGRDAHMAYRTLDYDVTVEDDGSLRIIETIDVRLDKQKNRKPWRQIYQRYTLDSNQLTGISGISVEHLDTGDIYTQGDIVQPKDVRRAHGWNSEHAGTWYIANVENPKSKQSPLTEYASITPTDNVADPHKQTVEIGWNIPETKSASSMRFRVEMTFDNVATSYDDVTKFQWEPVSKDNSVPIGTLTARVHYPQTLDDADSWAWLHFEGPDSSISRIDDGFEFGAHDLRSRMYVDYLSMTANDVTPYVMRTADTATKDATIAAEAQARIDWNSKRTCDARLTIAGIAIGAALWLFCVVMMVLQYLRILRGIRYRGPIEYWRGAPEISPAAAARLYNIAVDYGNGEAATAPAMAATLMALVNKHIIAVFPGKVSLYDGRDGQPPIDLTSATPSMAMARLNMLDEGHRRKAMKRCTFVLLPAAFDQRDPYTTQLCASERALLDILLEIGERTGGNVFDTKQMNKTVRKWKRARKRFRQFTQTCRGELQHAHAVKVSDRRLHWWGAGATAALLFVCVLLCFGVGEVVLTGIVACAALTLTLFPLIRAPKYTLDSQGEEVAGQVEGLARYLLDFSHFEDRTMLDVTLWGEYLVYATAFGISKDVVAQFASAAAELCDDAWLDAHADMAPVLYWSMRTTTMPGSAFANDGGAGAGSASFFDFGAQMGSNFSSMISAASGGGSSSGSGFGGGGGGAGGGSFGGR